MLHFIRVCAFTLIALLLGVPALSAQNNAALKFKQAKEAFSSNNYAQAEGLFYSLINEEKIHDSIEVGSHVYLGSIYGNQGNLGMALQHFNSAQHLATQSIDTTFNSRIYYSKALVFLNTNQLDSSKMYLAKWQSVLGDDALFAKAQSFQMLADCFARENKPVNELVNIRTAISLLESIEESSKDYQSMVEQKTLTANYNRICFLFLSSFNNIDSAYIYSKLAREPIEKQNTLQDTILFSLYDAVYALQIENKPKQSKKYLLDYLDYGLQNQWHMGMNEGYRNLQLVYRIENNYDSCVWSLDQMIALGKSNRDYHNLFWAYLSKVDYLQQFGEKGESIAVAREALHFAKTTNFDLQIVDNYLILAYLMDDKEKYAIADSAFQLLKGIPVDKINYTNISGFYRRLALLYGENKLYQGPFYEVCNEMIAIGETFNNEFVIEDGVHRLLDNYIKQGSYAQADSLFNYSYGRLQQAGLKLVLEMQMFYNQLEEYDRALLYAKQLKERALKFNNYYYLNAAIEGENIAYNYLGLTDAIIANKNQVAAMQIPQYEKCRMLSLCYTFLNTDSAIYFQKQALPLIQHDKELLYFAYSNLAHLYNNHQADSFNVYFEKMQEICHFSNNCEDNIYMYLSQDVTKCLMKGDIEKADSIVQILQASSYWNMDETNDVIDYMSLIFFKSLVEYVFKPLALNAGIALVPGFFEEIDFTNGRTLSYFAKLTKNNMTEFVGVLDGFNQYKYNKPPAFRKKLNAYIEYYYQLMSLVFETANDDELLKYAIMYHDMSKGQILFDVMNQEKLGANSKEISQTYLDKLFSSGSDEVILAYNYMVSWPNDAEIPFFGTINYINGAKQEYGNELLSIGHFDNVPASNFQISNLLASNRGAMVVQSESTPGKPSGVFGNVMPDNPDMIEANAYIMRYNEGLQEPTIDVSEVSRGLYQNLVSILKAYKLENEKLNIIPHNQLYYIPFETLIDESGKYLIESHDISYAPSIAILNTLKTSKHKDITNGDLSVFVASIADYSSFQLHDMSTNTGRSKDLSTLNYELEFRKDNQFDDLYKAAGLYYGWNDIPATASEVESIAKLFSRTELKQNTEASETAVKKLLQEKGKTYDVLHFATHGISLPEANSLSALVLQADENNDGFLRFDEIMDFELDARLVVLSACETGDGEIQAGEGLINLGYAFISAGAQNVVVSMWPVDDAATSLFMQSFYAMLVDNPQDIAYCLGETKRQFIAGNYGEMYKDPYYWAPFVLFGE